MSRSATCDMIYICTHKCIYIYEYIYRAHTCVHLRSLHSLHPRAPNVTQRHLWHDVYMHTYIHINIYIYIYTRIHTHIHLLTQYSFHPRASNIPECHLWHDSFTWNPWLIRMSDTHPTLPSSTSSLATPHPTLPSSTSSLATPHPTLPSSTSSLATPHPTWPSSCRHQLQGARLFSKLQHPATHYTTLQQTTTHCNTL